MYKKSCPLQAAEKAYKRQYRLNIFNFNLLTNNFLALYLHEPTRLNEAAELILTSDKLFTSFLQRLKTEALLFFVSKMSE